VGRLDQWRANVDSRTRLVFLETPSNPVQQVADVAAVSEIAHAAGALLVVDNTLLTPVFQNPLLFGADLVVQSAGKYIDGQGRCVAGAVLGGERLIAELRSVLRTLGATLSAMNAWLLLNSLETLEVRLGAISRTSEALAHWLRRHPKVGVVHYTGFPDHPQHVLVRRQQSGHGGVLSFEVGNSRDDAWRLIDALKLVSIAANIGETRSMVIHPATTTHCRLSPDERRRSGISERLVRLSVGLEHVDDLVHDLDQALARLCARDPDSCVEL
jgi:O-succinylhomoserine sulfhydrylase